jgi:hypothetical protein
MLTDEQLIHEIRTRLRTELGALDPSSGLVERVREQVATEANRRRTPLRNNLGVAMSALMTVGALAVAGILLATLHRAPHRAPSGAGTAAATLAEPKSLVVLAATGTRSARLELRSSRTGRFEKVAATLHASGPAGAFYDNSIALSPDGRDVYIVSPPGPAKQVITRISLASGHRTQIAEGEQPALSPDGHWLAYATADQPSQTLAVRDLTSGRTTEIGLARLLGPPGDISYSAIAWLDPNDVVVPTRHTGLTRLVLVHLAPAGPALRLYVLPNLRGVIRALAADATIPHTLVLAAGQNGTMLVERVTLSGGTLRTQPLGSIRSADALALDRAGSHLLYLKRAASLHALPSLWSVRIARDRLSDPHQVIANADVQEVAW